MKEDEILKNQKVLAFLPWIQASRQTLFLYLFIFWFLKIILVARKSYFCFNVAQLNGKWSVFV